MKTKNELQQAIGLTMQNIICIVNNLGNINDGYEKTGEKIIYKHLEKDKLNKANELASEMINAYYFFRFFEKNDIIYVKINCQNGCYVLPANTFDLIQMKKQMSKAWGKCIKESEFKEKKIVLPVIKKRINIKRKKGIKVLNLTYASNYHKNYYIYKGQKYYFIKERAA